MTTFWIWFAVTVLAIAVTWRREIVRDRAARRARAADAHPAGGRWGARVDLWEAELREGSER